jgi:glutathionylspermidine synthase
LLKFVSFSARENWQQQFAGLGFDLDLLLHPPYWMEAAAAPFALQLTAAQCESLEEATLALNSLALALVEEICQGVHSELLFDQLAIAPEQRAAVRESFHRRDTSDRSLYGRLDLAYFDGQFKLLELNFDNPTSIYETACLQSLWYADLVKGGAFAPDARQYNNLASMLAERLRHLIEKSAVLHVASASGASEDGENARYVGSLLSGSGRTVKLIKMRDIGFDTSRRLIDAEGEAIEYLFKIYPWDVLLADDRDLQQKSGFPVMTGAVITASTHFFEPLWKTILSSKAILPLLWRFAPGHANLLPACFDDGGAAAAALSQVAHVRKPFWGLGGGDVSVIFPDNAAMCESNPERYATNPFILQQYVNLPRYEDFNVVISSWLVGDAFAAISARADKKLVTGGGALFLPHVIGGG